VAGNRDALEYVVGRDRHCYGVARKQPLKGQRRVWYVVGIWRALLVPVYGGGNLYAIVHGDHDWEQRHGLDDQP